MLVLLVVVACEVILFPILGSGLLAIDCSIEGL